LVFQSYSPAARRASPLAPPAEREPRRALPVYRPDSPVNSTRTGLHGRTVQTECKPVRLLCEVAGTACKRRNWLCKIGKLTCRRSDLSRQRQVYSARPVFRAAKSKLCQVRGKLFAARPRIGTAKGRHCTASRTMLPACVGL
jgi:hypothetical protein